MQDDRSPERLRAALRQALADARRELAELEENNRRLHDELALMERSAGRRMLVRTRAAIGRVGEWLMHPAWSAGTVARRAASHPMPAAVRGLSAHLLRRSQLLRLSPTSRRWTDAPDEQAAIRWIGPVTIRHRSLEALLCHPNSGIEYRAVVPPGSRFAVECGISPQVWSERPSAVTFRVEIRGERTDWTRGATVSVNVTGRLKDRRWIPVRIEIPSGGDPGGEPVVVALSTAVAAGAPIEHAWALWGEPRFERRRPAADVRRSVSAFASRARAHGVKDALRLARGASDGDQNTELYARWVSVTTPDSAALDALKEKAAALAYRPLVSVVTPVYDTDPRWLRACIESVRQQIYPNWELCLCDDASTRPETVAVLREYESDPRIHVRYLTTNARISAATNAALDQAQGEFVALLDHDDELTPDALFRVAEYLNEHRDADLLYSDEDKLDLSGGRCDPYFKPDWSPEHFLTSMYTCHLMVVRRSVVERVGRFRTGYEGAQDYDLVLRVMDTTDRIHHIPRVLYHWRKLPQSTASAGQAKPWALDAGRLALEDYVRRRGLDAEVLQGAGPGVFRVRRRIRGSPLVSIVIPTAGRLRREGSKEVDLVATCIQSVARKTTYANYEVIIVADAAGVQPTTARALEGTPHRVLRFDAQGQFNFSRKVNFGVAAAAGEHVVLFNDDLEVISSEWLSAMLEYSQDPAIGAVGAKLLYPDGRLQHIGMILGVSGIAAHAFHQHPGSSPGYAGGALCVRNYSAVTAACLMSRREVFTAVGGFDETFPIDFNDVDYCLRVRQAGYRIVFTPHAQLYHHESASFGARIQDAAGAEEMRRRWGAVLDRDPYYNPNLTREYADYRIRIDGQ